MYQPPEQLLAMNKANLDVAMRLAGIALQSVEKMVDLQMGAARAALAESASGVRALSGVKDLQDLAALRGTMMQPSLDKATAYAREVYGVAASAQAELQKVIEAQVADFNKNVVTQLEKVAKSSPAGAEFAVAALKSAVASANAAFDNVAKVAKQVGEITESNLSAATGGKARKAA